MMVHPASVAQVGNLDTDDFEGEVVLRLPLFACRRAARLVQGDARNFFGQNVTVNTTIVSTM